VKQDDEVVTVAHQGAWQVGLLLLPHLVEGVQVDVRQ
jgi:hypothetical protein